MPAVNSDSLLKGYKIQYAHLGRFLRSCFSPFLDAQLLPSLVQTRPGCASKNGTLASEAVGEGVAGSKAYSWLILTLYSGYIGLQGRLNHDTLV